MKKYFAIAVFAIGTMSLTSCSSDCCSLLTIKQCEGDEPSGMTWAEYKDSLDNIGYNCD